MSYHIKHYKLNADYRDENYDNKWFEGYGEKSYNSGKSGLFGEDEIYVFKYIYRIFLPVPYIFAINTILENKIPALTQALNNYRTLSPNGPNDPYGTLKNTAAKIAFYDAIVNYKNHVLQRIKINVGFIRAKRIIRKDDGFYAKYGGRSRFDPLGSLIPPVLDMAGVGNIEYKE